MTEAPADRSKYRPASVQQELNQRELALFLERIPELWIDGDHFAPQPWSQGGEWFELSSSSEGYLDPLAAC